MATHTEIVAEGDRIDSALATMQRLIAEKDTIPEQLAQIKSNAATKTARLTILRQALDRDCSGCDHPVNDHGGAGMRCLAHTAGSRCACPQWQVNV